MGFFVFNSLLKSITAQEGLLLGVFAITPFQAWVASCRQGSTCSQPGARSRYAVGKFHFYCFPKSFPSEAVYLLSTAFLRRPPWACWFSVEKTQSRSFKASWHLSVPTCPYLQPAGRAERNKTVFKKCIRGLWKCQTADAVISTLEKCKVWFSSRSLGASSFTLDFVLSSPQLLMRNRSESDGTFTDQLLSCVHLRVKILIPIMAKVPLSLVESVCRVQLLQCLLTLTNLSNLFLPLDIAVLSEEKRFKWHKKVTLKLSVHVQVWFLF